LTKTTQKFNRKSRWDKFSLRREMATVIERSLRETLGGEPAAAIKPAA
jgi:hypothetical protein